MNTRNYMLLSLRLSFVIAICFTLYDSFQNYSVWNDQRNKKLQMLNVMRCAAKLSDEWLFQNKNKYGNIDVSIKCGFPIDGSEYLTNMKEINEIRSGIIDDIFKPKSYEFTRTAIAFFNSFIGAITIGISIFAAYRVFRWIWSGRYPWLP